MARTAVSCALAAAVAAVSGAARADAVWVLDGNANVSLSTTSTDGTAASERASADFRPSALVQVVGERLAFRGGYIFDGAFDFDGSNVTYSNAVDFGLLTQLSPRVTLALNVGGTQGSQIFQQSARAADVEQPGFRVPGNPGTVQGNLGEALSFDAAPGWRFVQGLVGLASTQEDDLSRYGLSATLSLSLDHIGKTDAVGIELRSAPATLTPVIPEGQPVTHYFTVVNTLLGHWVRDFGRAWNGNVSAGVQQVLSLTGSEPVAILPTGNLAVRWTQGRFLGGATYDHGATTNLEVGTVSTTDGLSLRGVYSFAQRRPRALSASAGIIHSAPIGEAAAVVSAGTGDALQLDASLVWDLSPSVLGTVRYSLGYQFDQANHAPSSMSQVLLVGVSARYGDAGSATRFPVIGGARVDGTDAESFPDKHGPIKP